ncbi:glycosyltransferase family 4 protein [Empedobacter brevis]|uniref:Glycosyltransferase family 4 protein n=1 Tax=Empedobacter brevis TaxID=247 RepID=A0AAJ1V8F3_9FLAO|nr:glycosyltransferase family 1 protein [Empedobacter brevis]MDM1073369.1 glycosyltransferase family 4 protein [Empedobacter brevis]
MKIFVDGYLLNREYQGTRTYITELYKALSVLDKSIKITYGIDDLTDELKNEFRDFPTIGFYVFKEKNKWKRMFTEYAELSRNYDYMHFQYIIPFRKANQKCKYINTIHDVLFLDFKKDFPFFYRLSRRILFGWSAKKCDLLLTVSEYSKKRISTHFNLNLEDIYTTPNGVNEKFLKNYNKSQVQKIIEDKYKIKKYILYVSRIEPRKNQLQLLKLFVNTKKVNQEYQLVFVGKKSLEADEFSTYFNSLDHSIKNKIKYFEQIDNEFLVDIYKAADFFVYPSLCEGFGIPPLEAGAAEIPVLCNNATALSDFGMFKTYLIDFNTEKLSSIFEEFVMNNQSDLKSIKSEISKKYTWEASAVELHSLLHRSSIFKIY